VAAFGAWTALCDELEARDASILYTFEVAEWGER
jgi:hypothetical protein